MTYKAFISYSHAADDKLAPALQSALHRFAKPFYRLRALRVFRDKTSLHLTPELWPLIQQALSESEYFLLLASPAAAASQWVQAEVQEWLRLRNGSADKILIVLTDGELYWDDASNDFDWGRTNALPTNLRGVFRREPLYSDLRWAHKATDLSLRNPQFLDEVGSLGATLHGKSKDEMIGADVRQHRLFKSVTAAALLLLLALTGVATGTAFYAVRQRDEAERQTVVAQEQRAEADRQRQSAVAAAERERQAADNERQARENEERERKKAELATENEKAAKVQADERRREAERQRIIADQRRREAERERSLATSRELAASAESQLTTDPELSVMLSLKAQERMLTAEAEDSLRRALLRSRVRATFKTSNWYKVTYSPDGRWFVLLTSSAQVIEPGTWRVVAELNGPGRWSSVKSVSFSRDGKSLLTCSRGLEDKQTTLRLWEVGTWRVANEIQFADTDSLTRAVLSLDGRLAVTWGPEKGRPRVWNLATRKSITLGDEDGFTEGVALSPDGRTVATVTRDRHKKVRLWESAAGRLLHEADCNLMITSYNVAFGPDGKHVAMTCVDGTTKVIAAGTWETVAVLRVKSRYATGTPVFSPDGKVLLTIEGRTALVWETKTWQPSSELRGHTGELVGMSFSGDGKVLVTSSRDGTARAWEADTWRGLAVLQGGHTMPMHDLAVSPEGHYVVTTATDSLARVWDLGVSDAGVAEIDGSSVNEPAEELPTVYSPDGRYVATSGQGRVVQVWETGTGRMVAELDFGAFLGFGPDGKYALTRTRELVKMWDTQTWQKVADLRGQSERVMGVAFSPDGRFVATAGDAVEVWEAGTGRSVNVLKERSWRAAFSPDGKWIATFSGDKVRIREVGTWRDAAVLSGHAAGLRAMAFSRDGSRLVTAGEDETARVWEVGTWRGLAVLRGHTDRLYDVTFSPDGRYVLTASPDDTARLWEAETGKAVAVLGGHTDSVDSARFSPDGRLIATAGDTTVRIWDGTTGRPVTVLQVLTPGRDSRGGERKVRAASFSPDGKSLLVSGSDQTTRVYAWEMFAPLEDLLALARTRVTRELTAVEKKRYLHQATDEKEGAAQPE